MVANPGLAGQQRVEEADHPVLLPHQVALHQRELPGVVIKSELGTHQVADRQGATTASVVSAGMSITFPSRVGREHLGRDLRVPAPIHSLGELYRRV